MKSSHHKKKSVAEIQPSLLSEPTLSNEDWREYEEGWQLFNARKFWEAHEAWESVWRRRPEESRIFFQGIIQLAAAYHLLVVKRRYGGMMRNFEKAEERLQIFPENFLGVNVARLLLSIAKARQELRRIGAETLEGFNHDLIPHVELTRITEKQPIS